MQQPQPAMGPMGSVPQPNITTEQIQKYLDENKQLILAILDNQNLGRLSECAQFQAQLQKNLLYLAAIADAQPQAPAVRLQMTPQGGMPQASSPYMQQQSPNFPPKAQMQFTHQQVQELQQQQLQHQPHMMPFQGQLGMRPVSIMNGMQAAMHAESSSLGHNNKHDAANVASQNTDSSIQKKSANDDLVPAAANLRKPEDAKSS